MRVLVFNIVAVVLIASAASAGPIESSPPGASLQAIRNRWSVSWTMPALVLPAQASAQEPVQPLHAAAIEHSQAYERRARIHKDASYAMLPLFAAEVALGQALDGSKGDPRRGLHALVGAGIVGLFSVNTVTGAWNLFGEGRRETDGRARRLVHGLLMMVADAGFLATTASAPNTRAAPSSTFESGKARHRNIAIASVSVGTAGYLMMLFRNR